MRGRLPSPALVVASLALFVALGGAGFAASLALVKAPQPIVLVSGSVGTDGKVAGSRLTGGRQSVGVYTLTIRGDTFASPSQLRPRMNSAIQVKKVTVRQGAPTMPPSCVVASENIASNGSAKAEVDCFVFDPAAGWQPADSAFDLQIVGPGR